MGQYYYRPVDPGWSALGAGIAGGIEQGMEGFVGGREKKRERERQDEEDARRRAQEDAQAKRELLADEMWLISQGGGLGRAPGATDLDFGRPGMAMAGRPDQSLFGQPPRLGPEEPSAIRQQLERKGPILTPVGPPGYGYMPTSESREKAAYQREQTREEQEYQTGRQRNLAEEERLALILGPAASRLAPNLPEEEVGRYLAAGGSAGALQPPRFSPEYLAGMEEEAKIGAKYRQPSGGATDRGLPTFTQAFQTLKDLYPTLDEYGDVSGYKLSELQMYNLAQAMARGEKVDLPDPDELEGESRSPFGVPTTFDEMVRGATVGAAPPPATLTDRDIAEIRAEMQRFPQEQWEEILRQMGYSAAEIERISG